jgi:hypothetical protein
MSVAPLVRRVLVCRKVEAESAQLGAPYTVRGVLTAVRPPAESGYPVREEELWLFAQYADGQGTHAVKFELVRLQLESDEVIPTFDSPPIHMTRGRFFVLNRGYRFTKLAFPAPGMYQFRIRCGVNVGTDELRLEERT